MQDKNKVVLIYILVLLFLGLVGFLIYFIIANQEKPAAKTVDPETNISMKCVFDMTMSKFNDIENNEKLCDGLNKINITDVDMGENKHKMYVVYANDDSVEYAKTGINLDGNRIISSASIVYKNLIKVIGNKLFIISTNDKYSDVSIYSDDDVLVYNLKSELERLQIADPAFAQLNQSLPSFGSTLTYNYIDPNSIVVTGEEIAFDSNSKIGCEKGQNVSGSSYKVTFKDNTFSVPTFIKMNSCS